MSNAVPGLRISHIINHKFLFPPRPEPVPFYVFYIRPLRTDCLFCFRERDICQCGKHKTDLDIWTLEKCYPELDKMIEKKEKKRKQKIDLFHLIGPMSIIRVALRLVRNHLTIAAQLNPSRT